MKRVKVNAYQVGLVFKDGGYQRMLLTGKYWFWKNEVVIVYDIAKQFIAPIELDILLQDRVLADILTIVDVKGHEIALQYQNGLLKEVLTAGRYAFWKSMNPYEFIKADISKIDIPEYIDRTVLVSRQVTPFTRSVTIESHEEAVLFVDGKFDRILQNGVYYWWNNAIPVNAARVDKRQQQLEINGQEILTKDKAALRLNAWAQYKVTDLQKAVLDNKEYDKQLYVSFQLAVREYVAGFTLDELLEKKESISASVLAQVKAKAENLGVTVLGFGIRDIILPGDVKDIINQVLVAEKRAQANSIMRREETASTRSLLNTAKLMEENAMLWKLKEMEYVEKIAEKVSHINLGGNGLLVEQLKQLFVAPKT
ncbi:slipin family protein [Terrimonas sp. NA20]|uniref:Slipin family protein n=1 Tax=Terrimonas ginsenosidimutans TaxID=2908004 RepID=A0ABS9KNP9_9BACT|nr:slipin family protein [Terrimonas ginsenosidimutans]MCG2613957.1 slipin family protein [Terrimonas ginsenosidimutans]